MTEHFTVTVADDHRDRLDDVVAALRAAGATVTQVLPALGLVSVTGSDGVRSQLEAVPGVAAVETDLDHHTRDPD
jgi:hypothetical protein